MMRRFLWALIGIAAAPLARAQETPPPAPLPVRAVTLFSSGVSFTLREGEVRGDTRIPLVFRTTQINDILKSMVLLDEKGQVRPAVYATKDPIGRTLQSFAVDVTQPMSRAELLNRLRGVKASVDLQSVTPNATTRETVTGQIVGVESRVMPMPPPQAPATVETLTLLGDDGLQYVPLDAVRSLKLLDERLNQEFRSALGLLASASDDRRRQVELRFDGQGARRVRVGYVTEAPLWKVSYRLLLGGADIGGTEARPATASEKPYLQGWALVENTSDEDWKDVRLTLVSGRPISFIQDLYQPLYLPRPVVAPDIQASPNPQVSEGAVEEGLDKAAAPAPASRAMLGRRPAGPGGGFGGGAGGALGLVAPGAEMEMAGKKVFDAAAALRSVQAQASGEAAGELFRYQIKIPVSLPRQQAAMIPILAGGISGEKVSVYNPDTIHPTLPMNAVRLKNDTGLHLKAGPVTLFDDGTYAGDARLPDVPPGDSRLVTYALDLSVTAERQAKGGPSIETGISIQRGVLNLTRKETSETLYTLKNKADRARTILVEHPFDSAWKLVAPTSFDERTPSLYRFAVRVDSGKSQTLTVRTERPIQQQVALFDGDLEFLSLQVQRKEGIPEKVRVALQDIVARRRKVQELQSRAAQAEMEIQSIVRDQDRVRQNMTALDRTSELYKRYVAQLDEQETKIQSLRAEATRLRAQAGDTERELRALVDTLTITA